MMNDALHLKPYFTIKDHSDERGFSYALEAGLKNFHIVSIRPGKIRGDHLHDYNEVVIVLGGKDMAEIELGDDPDRKRIIVDSNFYTVLFPAFIKHLIRNIGDQDFYLVCFSH